ncbi:MAG TPA: hypothetical protein VFX59_06110 [Polyangiales bacterium]|nr:hypothetical protein [Polyangiales bacterium]
MKTIAAQPGTGGEPGFSQLLNYAAMVANGVVVLKDDLGTRTGPLLAGYWYDGVDHENASDEALDDLIRVANRAFRKFSTGWMLHFEVIRRAEVRTNPADVTEVFDEPVDQLVAEERAAAGVYWRMDCAIFLTYTPPLFDGSELRALVTGAEADTPARALARRIEAFESSLLEFERIFGSACALRRMRLRDGNDELLQALHYVLNGKWQRCRLPPNPLYLDVTLARELMLSADVLEHGDDAVAVVGVTELPESAYPGLMSAFRELDLDFRVASRFIFLDPAVANRKLERLERKWSQMYDMLKNLKLGSLNEHAAEMAQQTAIALRDLTSGEIRYGHFTFTVVLRGATQPEADAKARAIIGVLEAKGFMPVLEKRNRMEAFLGGLPGHGKQNVRAPLINTVNLGMLCDLDRLWPGDARCPNRMIPNAPSLMRVRNWHGGSFDLNLHQRDVGHTLILGLPGGGKTVLQNHLMSQFLRYRDAQVIAFDYKAGCLPLTLARRDAAYYTLGAEGGPQLCPLAELDTPDDLSWAEQWVTVLCEEQGIAVTREEAGKIRRALQELSLIRRDLGTGRRLTDLLPHLQDDGLEAALDYYVTGVGARVLNGATTEVAYARVTAFELEELLKMDAKVVTPTLLYLFRQVERRLDGRPTMIPIAEAWATMNHPRFAPVLERWLNTLRSKNAFVVMDTQQLTQVVNSPIADTVLSGCVTTVLLPGKLTDTIRELYRVKLGVTEQQLADLSTLVPESDVDRRWYLWRQGNRSRWFTLDALGPVAQTFLGATSQNDVARVASLAAQHGAAWPEALLRARGAGEAAGRFASLRSAQDAFLDAVEEVA